MKKRLTAVICFFLILSSFGMAFGAVPSDVANTKYEKAVSEMTALGIMSGYPDGTFLPDKTITRAEMAKVIISALKLDDDAIQIYASGLTDVNASWAKGFIGYADQLNIVTGYSDKTFKPQKTVSYNEAVTMLVRALGYTDLKESWPANYISKAIELGLISEAPAAGSAAISRGDVAVLINQALNIPIAGVSGDTIQIRQTAAERTYEKWQIPYGDRLIYTTGLEGAVTDSTPTIPNSSYWQMPDFYNATSDDTLTILTNFKTTQQTTEWTCGPASALMTLDWYGKRGDLNELDLAALRQNDEPGATTLKQMINIYKGLEATLGQKWDIYSTYDTEFDWKDDGLPYVTYEGKSVNVFQWIPQVLAEGKPIIVGWNDWGGHYQVIIGYDTMGTDTTIDDVLVLADPYDTTDHKQDGYLVQSAERLVWDWSASWDPDFDYGIFLVASPSEGNAKTIVTGSGIADDKTNKGDFSDDQLIPYGSDMAADVLAFSKTEPYATEHPVWFGADGLSGPASSDIYRNGDHNYSPYYRNVDVYDLKSTKTLTLLEKYKTTQQTTEYTCGLASMESVLEWFGKRGDLNDIDLANMRDKTNSVTGTSLKEMMHVISKLPDQWNVKTSYDLVNGDSAFECGIEDDGTYVDLGDMIPHYLKKGIPVMVLWHEWGGHYQVVIGYDNMGTEATCDDVLLLMDPYDTTDHNQNGYVVESYERLLYDWGNAFDEDIHQYGFVIMEPAK